MMLAPSINYNTDTGLDVVFELFPVQTYTITLCVCVHPGGIAYKDKSTGYGYCEHTSWT